MYLKKIIAQGFKSFASKITIDLDDKITGIVGPNGSGKSNIVDAIRWVLGEQSVKSLRGDGSMSDVIFSGSKSRNPLNVASVTLVFDNSDAYLPLNYNEVSIKRRVYRDGTNEYYLNGEKCRLKDISDILLDTGIAKESFNIISQGKIEEIISNKPDARRTIFEEAARVLKYKRRKEEALKKIDKTSDNINRVNDIINELENQIKPLKIEKEKALEYIKIKEELENIEVSLITNDITNLNYKYQDKLGKIKNLNKEILNINTSNTTSEAKIEDYKNKITKIDLKLKEKNRELIEIISKTERINSQKSIILERKKYEVENTKIHNNIINLKEELLKIDENINKNKLEIESLKLDINKKDENLAKLDIENTKQIKNNLEIELTNLNRLEMNLNTKIKSLKDTIENNYLIPTPTRKILENPKLTGIHNIVGNLIEVENKYKNAISLSLGFNVNNIIVDDETKAKEAIEYLKANNIGRATFFPLNIIKPKYIDNNTLTKIKEKQGFIDIAANLIKVDDKYKNIIYNQLGNVIVIDNIDNANKISKLIEHRYKIITLDGEILHIGGLITGGRSNKSNNIITLKYEMEKENLELEKLIEKIKQIETKINEYDKIMRNLEDKFYLINKEKLELNELLNIKNNTINQLLFKEEAIKLELESSNNILENKISNEEEKILNDYYESLKEKDKITNEINILNKEKDNLNDELEEFEYKTKKENTLITNKSRELHDLEIEVNRIDVKLDNLINTLSEVYSITYEKATTLYKLELEENIARNKVLNLKKFLKNLGDVNLKAKEEYENIASRYEFLLNQREDLMNALNTLFNIIKEMDTIMQSEFIKTFEKINENFKQTFKELFKGGKASLKLVDPDNLLETGVEIIASPPGKKLTSISLLSGGEKTLTAISLLFAILKSKEVPFCILDEVEAALDEANVDSFGEYITKLKQMTQFILITHKKKTMEYADTLYGITMQESGVSKLVSVKLENIKMEA